MGRGFNLFVYLLTVGFAQADLRTYTIKQIHTYTHYTRMHTHAYAHTETYKHTQDTNAYSRADTRTYKVYVLI